MALVTKTLLDLVRNQIETHGTVVWYDPERAYVEWFDALRPDDVAGAALHRYDPDRGFFWLRHELDPLWEGRTDPPRLLIYIPLDQEEASNALIEFEVGGVVMQPGQQPPERNTALVAVARRALQDVIPPAALEQILAQVRAGQLTLAELDDLAEQRVAAQSGVIATIFETGNPSEVALRFLGDPSLDERIRAKGAVGNLARLLSDLLGVDLPTNEGLDGLRARLARLVLLTDLIEGLGKVTPPALRTLPLAPHRAARRAAVELARDWRHRTDLAESYVDWARRVEAEIGMGSLDLDVDALARTETFLTGEVRLQAEVEEALLRRPSADLLQLAEERMGRFWSRQEPQVKARWEVIADAGRLLVEAKRVESALKGKKWSAKALFNRYAADDQPWCTLDTAQRHLERDYHQFELDLSRHASLVKLVTRARQRYAEVADRLAETFLRAYRADRFELPGVLSQSEVYREFVEGAEGRVANILVDAFRFEMARELAQILEREWEIDLTPVAAIPPTVTEVGMAALMPRAERGLTLVPAKRRKLAAVVDGKILETRRDRVKHFKEAVGQGVEVVRLEQLAPLDRPDLRRRLESAPVVLITAAEEIDGLCENTPSTARRMMDDVLNQLRRAVQALAGVGIQTVVISADHGYLFGQRLTKGEGIDPPRGETALLKRRVWAGRGGADSPSLMRAPLSAFGIGGDLEIATPWNLSCFKVQGGSMEYFHGGLSLPELVVPVLRVRPAGPSGERATARVRWKLTLGSAVISTRFLSVTVEGRSEEVLPIEPPRVRVEVRAEGRAISVPVSASYGFQEATRDVELAVDKQDSQAIAANTITLMITETPAVDAVSVHLLDAATGVSLACLERVPFSISL